MSKKIFDIYVFQFNTLTNVSLDVDLSSEESFLNKNSIFTEILNKELIFNYKHLDLKYNVCYHADRYTVLKIARDKRIEVEENFSKRLVKTEPSSSVIIDNDINIQRIYIESDRESFGNSNVLKGILEKTFRRQLKKFGLSITLIPEFEAKEFWKMISNYENRIVALRFNLNYFNLPSAHKKILGPLKEFANNINGATNVLSTKAADGDVLDNINEDNRELRQLVNAAADGQGSVEFREKRSRIWQSTKYKNKTVTTEIDIPLDIDDDKLKLILEALNKPDD